MCFFATIRRVSCLKRTPTVFQGFWDHISRHPTDFLPIHLQIWELIHPWKSFRRDSLQEVQPSSQIFTCNPFFHDTMYAWFYYLNISVSVNVLHLWVACWLPTECLFSVVPVSLSKRVPKSTHATASQTSGDIDDFLLPRVGFEIPSVAGATCPASETASTWRRPRAAVARSWITYVKMLRENEGQCRSARELWFLGCEESWRWASPGGIHWFFGEDTFLNVSMCIVSFISAQLLSSTLFRIDSQGKKSQFQVSTDLSRSKQHFTKQY